MLERLQRTHTAVYIATRDGPFGSYHRVRIGPFQARREAHNIAQALADDGYYVFLDEVGASSLLHQRLQMAAEGGSREFAPLAPTPPVEVGPNNVDVRDGLVSYLHSFD
jgi:hypothetical protein